MKETQLLCTFCSEETLDDTLRAIVKSYDVAFGSIYVLENVNSDGELCCTYNVIKDAPIQEPVPLSTISLHRKKQTNTLYTINALNHIVMDQNDGKIDKRFPIDWSKLRNMILVTQYGQLKKISTKIRQIVKIEDIV